MSNEVRQRADQLCDLGRFDAALQALGPALAVAPQDPGLLLVAARAHLGAERYASAESAAVGVLTQDPANQTALLVHGYASLGRQDWLTAESVARHGLSVNATDWRFHALFSRSVATRDRHLAQFAAEHAVSLAPLEPATHRAAAYAYYPPAGLLPMRSELDAAEAALLRALELDPGSTETLNNLGRVKLAKGERADAANLLARAVESDPFDAIPRTNMDIVLRRELVITHFVVAASCLLAGAIGIPTNIRIALGVAAAISLARIGWVAHRLRRSVQRNVGAYLRNFARADRLGAAWAVGLALCVVAMVVGAAVGPAYIALHLGQAMLIVGVILSWGSRFSRRRRI